MRLRNVLMTLTLTAALPATFVVPPAAASTRTRLSIKVSTATPRRGADYLVTFCWGQTPTAESVQLQRSIGSARQWRMVFADPVPESSNGCYHLTFRTTRATTPRRYFYRARAGSPSTGLTGTSRVVEVRVSKD